MAVAVLGLVVAMLLAGCSSGDAGGDGDTGGGGGATAPTEATGSVTDLPSSAVERRAPAGPAAGCGRPSPMPPGQTTEASLTSGGRQRTYLVHVPATYQPNRPLPVVLAFHGRKGTGTDIEGFSGIDALNAVAVYPKGLPADDGETAWQGAPGVSGVDDVHFVDDLLNRLRSTLCVDQARVFATGKSEGGGFAALLACQLSSRIAAVATVSGAFYPGTGAGCAGSPPMPLLDFHGTNDPIIHYAGGVSHRQSYPAMTGWLRGWAEHDRCAPNPGTSTIGSDVTVLTWSGCAPGSALVHYRLAGGGHTWAGAVAPSGPGATTKTISATQVMWTFFRAHPLA
ncbi:MAG TPA: PHB depolymerase family esterase [Pseudonocardia sp.]|jgi:polyhydroxybutyrate depolymerase|nr:PHB depolymerase family esterase [Pseudonocardia sp.]